MTFSEKLSSIMVLTGMTNSKMARALNVDPSLVSRWRSGSRRPEWDSEQMTLLAEYIAGHIDREHHVTLASALLKGVELPSSPEESALSRSVFHWLNDKNARLFEPNVVKPPAKSPLPPKLMQSKAFAGRNGRRLVLERLYHVLMAQSSNQTLRLYSGNLTEWVSSDIQCREGLAASNSEISDYIESIRIIVDQDIKMKEMVHLFHFLLPFIPNASVRIAQTSTSRNALVTNTFYIAGTDVAVSCQAFASSSSSVTNLFLNKSYVAKITNDFDAVFATCTPLNTPPEDSTLCGMLNETMSMFSTEQPIFFVGSTLPAVFLSVPLLKRLLHKCGIYKCDDNPVFAQYEERLAAFVSKQRFVLSIPLYQPREIADGAMCIVGIPRFLGARSTIDLELYIDILSHLHTLLVAYPHVQLRPSCDYGHEHNLYIQKDTRVLVTRTKEPYIHSSSTVPFMVEALTDFSADQHGLPPIRTQREAALERLSAHIQQLKAAL